MCLQLILFFIFMNKRLKHIKNFMFIFKPFKPHINPSNPKPKSITNYGEKKEIIVLKTDNYEYSKHQKGEYSQYKNSKNKNSKINSNIYLFNKQTNELNDNKFSNYNQDNFMLNDIFSNSNIILKKSENKLLFNSERKKIFYLETMIKDKKNDETIFDTKKEKIKSSGKTKKLKNIC